MNKLIDLIKIIEEKNKKYDFNTLDKLNININEKVLLQEKSLLYNEIKRDNYFFKIFVIEKNIPIKNKTSKNKLEYNFEKNYFLNVIIDDDNSFCVFTIESSKDIMIIKDSYNYYLNLVTNSSINNVFNELIKIVK